MNKTPQANRIHIGIFGKRNVGKSSLLNAICGQQVSLVSPIQGTTTDPVKKAMELVPVGPVLFIDTAGLDDSGEVGKLRVEKTKQIMQEVDLALFVMDVNDPDLELFNKIINEFKKLDITFLTVFNKIDTVGKEKIEELKTKFPGALFVSAKNPDKIQELKEALAGIIKEREERNSLIADLLPQNSKVILVIRIDEAAPKGRLILPQVQLIRDCLDHGIKCYVVRDSELESALNDIKGVDLVITDSSIFKKVAEIVPESVPLTSFSILFARYKGNLHLLLEGIKKLEELPEEARILIAESCTHAVTCEDIGRVKIPALLNKHLKKKLTIDVASGQDFPQNITDYDLVIHCGACMLNKKAMVNRLKKCQEKGVAVTNYGMILAHFSGILQRATEIFS
ncbi:MAG: [FeFe] hydrogenase H-cluster maturation GTPase HydF [Halanaerobiaceae bacterium]|nr:[FeFe] hydrogenase H-cluster maturation GTPase HydF [Halanaerobiaceae bacterium]